MFYGFNFQTDEYESDTKPFLDQRAVVINYATITKPTNILLSGDIDIIFSSDSKSVGKKKGFSI